MTVGQWGKWAKKLVLNLDPTVFAWAARWERLANWMAANLELNTAEMKVALSDSCLEMK